MKTVSSTAHAESNALFLRYQNGHTNALSELYNRWNNYIVKRITQSNAFSCREDIEDTASEVWIRVQEEALKWDINRSSWFKFLDYATGKVIHDTLKWRNAYKRRSDDSKYSISLDSLNTDIPFPIEQLASDEPSAIDTLMYNERVEAVKRAIEVCRFPRQVKQILRLRLQGLSHIAIQQRLDLKSRSQVGVALSRAVKELQASIDPKTLQIQPQPTTEYAYGIQLAELCRKREYKPMKLAKDLEMSLEVLMAFFKEDRKPQAPVLQRMAKVLGEAVYAIYAPPLMNYPYSGQGQQLWYARVRQGYTLQKLARLIYLRAAASIKQYECGTSRPSEDRLSRMAETLYAPQLLGIYNQ